MGKQSRSNAMESIIADVDGELAKDGFRRVDTVQRNGTLFARYFSRGGGIPAVVVFEDTAGGAEATVYKDGDMREIKAGGTEAPA